MAKKDLYPDIETENTFKNEQGKRERPECFGNHGNPAKTAGRCSRCWFRPECKATPKKKTSTGDKK